MNETCVFDRNVSALLHKPSVSEVKYAVSYTLRHHHLMCDVASEGISPHAKMPTS